MLLEGVQYQELRDPAGDYVAYWLLQSRRLIRRVGMLFKQNQIFVGVSGFFSLLFFPKYAGATEIEKYE